MGFHDFFEGKINWGTDWRDILNAAHARPGGPYIFTDHDEPTRNEPKENARLRKDKLTEKQYKDHTGKLFWTLTVNNDWPEKNALPWDWAGFIKYHGFLKIFDVQDAEEIN